LFLPMAVGHHSGLDLTLRRDPQARFLGPYGAEAIRKEPHL
jgi:hypothetical protein